MKTTPSLTVFYDGACPLCAREIAFYQRRAGAQFVEWRDISGAEGDVAPGLSCDAAMARFHVRTGDGELHSGAPAFVHLWSRLPAFRWAAMIGQIWPFSALLSFAYSVFLRVRPRLQSLAASA
ncbi:MAG: DUF393 domain-containing protein [Pseudomonadota bacterium]